MIKYEKIISFDMDQNCFMVYDDENMQGILIDPGFDTAKILKATEEKGVFITHILLTHCHYDHTYSVNELRGSKKLVTGKECAENIQNSNISLTFTTGNAYTIEAPDIILSDNEEIILPGIKIKAIEAPGHTNCCMCYLIGDVLFSGDVLFKRNVGRWDLPTGDGELLKKSIREKLYALPDETVVMCGHGSDTTIGYEKKFNFFVN